ncbi:MAG: hypothetical protein UR94_C0029G0012 [Parcubacteria group bacterium GW2011_GWA2_36_10]|nr:MAG: hypothetical protein UR94_C0029G0012 [Parcubacteria group bacterium GW2011_GWA2_36_10]
MFLEIDQRFAKRAEGHMSLLDVELPSADEILVPLSNGLFVPLAWALDVLAEHQTFYPVPGQLWALHSFGPDGASNIIDVCLELVEQQESARPQQTTLHFVRLDREERFALTLAAFFAMQPHILVEQ